jgi:hypothetical protein
MREKEIPGPVVIAAVILTFIAVLGIGVFLLNRPTPVRGQFNMPQNAGKGQSGGMGRRPNPRNAIAGTVSE